MSKRFFVAFAIILMLFSTKAVGQEKVFVPGNFNKVTVSPHIQVIFQKGLEQKVEVMSITEPLNKFNLELKNNRLHLFLDGAKISTKSKKSKGNNWSYNKPIYKGTVAKVVVTYTDLVSCDLRGEQAFLFKSAIEQNEFKIAIYGESDVTVNEIEVDDLVVKIYGESTLALQKGHIDTQKITGYGESEIHAFGVESDVTKLTSYGEGDYKLTVNNDLNVTSFGESTVEYMGDPDVNKRVVIGETSIRRAHQ